VANISSHPKSLTVLPHQSFVITIMGLFFFKKEVEHFLLPSLDTK
jgi:hypothetical protein